MGYTIYLKIDGLAGDCADPGHRGWYVLDNFGQSLSCPPVRSEATYVTDLTLSKFCDRSTPQLAKAAAERRYFKEAVLELAPADGPQVGFLQIRLTKVRITSYSICGNRQGDVGAPYENLSIGFEKIEWVALPGTPEETRADWVNEAAMAVN
ncbi:MAG TPA: type VI secretion system tube protein Hcp [Planctomycetota bacterium]|nr:type VI secretion system tube protein Hcp [Planctomycetota bacterium]